MPPIKPILEDFKLGLKRVYHDRLRAVILYGSWARGEATENSDIDLLIVLGGRVSPGREIDRIIELVTNIGLKYNVLLSVYPISERKYARVNSPLLLNIRREGVPA